jgi:hypothetical protein
MTKLHIHGVIAWSYDSKSVVLSLRVIIRLLLRGGVTDLHTSVADVCELLPALCHWMHAEISMVF